MNEDEILDAFVDEFTEPREVLMVEWIGHVQDVLNDLELKRKQGLWEGCPQMQFYGDENFRMEMLESGIDRLYNMIPEEDKKLMDSRQIAIELGYYVRGYSPMDTASSYTQYNALVSGTFEDWIQDMILSVLGNILCQVKHGWKKHKNQYHRWFISNTPQDIFDTLFRENELPTLRSVISIGEHFNDLFSVTDFQSVLAKGKAGVKEAVEEDETILSANWYWEEYGMDVMHRHAIAGCEPFFETNVVSNVQVSTYMQEWVWDIVASKYVWGPLDWERIGTWCGKKWTLQKILDEEVKRCLGKDIKCEYFPDIDSIKDWQGDNV